MLNLTAGLYTVPPPSLTHLLARSDGLIRQKCMEQVYDVEIGEAAERGQSWIGARRLRGVRQRCSG